MLRRLTAGLAAGVLSLAWAQAAPAQPSSYAVGPQYDSTHVYMSADDLPRFAQSIVATFGGTFAKPAVVTVTPTPSKELWTFIQTPVGPLSVFGFTTGVPWPFGTERTGYLVTDMDTAVAAARAAGADVLVAPFPDPIGRDVIVQWPGGVSMQLYVHNTAPSAPALGTIPENRIYISPDRADAFLKSFLAFSHGEASSDDASAPGVEIGRPGETYRRVRITSGFGKAVVMISDGQLPWPFGREFTGYEVADLAATLAKATATGAKTVVQPFTSGHRRSAMVQFPGGYLAEIHAPCASTC
jgi:predicted enzyme related to lactoylglutathione lyase